MEYIVSRRLPCMRESFEICLHCQQRRYTAALPYLNHVSLPTAYELENDAYCENELQLQTYIVLVTRVKLTRDIPPRNTE
ncbi:hypothetical protein LB504_002350 [Fusarium proliferatum]|nr:hypothetical protein LB504_002350 [Fusarium proliferatum]